MAVTFLNQSSSGAPTFNGAIGSLIKLLDFCLVTKMGWTKAYTGTNVASYRPATGNRMYLGVDDSSANNARVRGFESMTAAGVAVTSGTGPFPTDTQISGGGYIYKSSDSTTTRNWKFASDGTFFYLMIVCDGYGGELFTFGDVSSYVVSDAYCTIIGCSTLESNPTGGLYTSTPSYVGSYGYHYGARSYTQLGSSSRMAKIYSMFVQSYSGYLGAISGGVSFPSPIDGALYASRIYAAEAVGIRGHFPGLWGPAHQLVFADGDQITGSGDMAGRTFVVWSTPSPTWQILIETSNTWRT